MHSQIDVFSHRVMKTKAFWMLCMALLAKDPPVQPFRLDDKAALERERFQPRLRPLYVRHHPINTGNRAYPFPDSIAICHDVMHQHFSHWRRHRGFVRRSHDLVQWFFPQAFFTSISPGFTGSVTISLSQAPHPNSILYLRYQIILLLEGKFCVFYGSHVSAVFHGTTSVNCAVVWG